MEINLKIDNCKDEDFKLKQGDYVVDEDDGEVYVLSITRNSYKDETLYNLFSLSDGNRWDEPKNKKGIKQEIIAQNFQVYRSGRVDLTLSNRIY